MTGYTNKEAWTFFRNMVASDRVDNVPFDKSPLGETTGNPFFDAGLTHSEAVTIDTARMFATIASFMLENESMSSIFEPMLDKSDLMDLIFTANEHERLIREVAAEREAESPAFNAPTPIVMPDEGVEAQTFPSKKDSDDTPPMSPGGVMDFRSQANTGMYAWLGTVGGAAVHLIAQWTTGDNRQKIIDITLPSPIEGFESLESILKRQKLSEGIRCLTWDFFPWICKYYLAYAKKLPSKAFLNTLGALTMIMSVVVKMSSTTVGSELLMLFAMTQDIQTRTQADSSLIDLVNECGNSGEAGKAHEKLKDIVSRETKNWFQTFSDRGYTTAQYHAAIKTMRGKGLGWEPGANWIPKPNIRTDDFDDFARVALGEGGQMTKIIRMLPNIFTDDKAKKMIEQAVNKAFPSSSGVAKGQLIKFATTAREFGKDTEYCLKEAQNSSLKVLQLAVQASRTAESLRPSFDDPLNNKGNRLVGGLLGIFLLGYVSNAYFKRAAAQVAMIKAYGVFLMNRNERNPTKGIPMSNVDDVSVILKQCIEKLKTKDLITKPQYDAWNETITGQIRTIATQSKNMEARIDNASLTNKTNLYKDLARLCRSAMNNLVNVQTEVDDVITGYLERNNITIDERPLCAQLLEVQRSARAPPPVQPARGGGRRPGRSPGRRTGHNTSGSLVDQIVDRFNAELRG